MPTTSKPTTAQPSPFPSISPLPTIQPTTLDPPDPPVNVTLDPDTSETAWTDEGYGGEAATYLLYDGDVLAVAVDSGDRRLRRRRLARLSNRERHNRNRTHGETDGFNKDGSKREWDAKKGWRRRTAETLSFALEENVACFSTVTLTSWPRTTRAPRSLLMKVDTDAERVLAGPDARADDFRADDGRAERLSSS